MYNEYDDENEIMEMETAAENAEYMEGVNDANMSDEPVIEGDVIPQENIPDKQDETKEEKFIRLAEVRVGKAQNAIQRLGNLSNKSAYHYTDGQIEQMFGTLETEIARVKAKFSAKKDTTEPFKFK